VAYSDQPGLQNGKESNEYRPDNTDVEIDTNDNCDGYFVGNIRQTEWLKYTVEVTTSGPYDFIFTWADTDGGTGTLNINASGKDYSVILYVPK
jgi:hypothetical protein